MKKELYKLVVLILFSGYIICLNGINFSAIFVVSSLWIMYFAFVLKKVAKLKNQRWINILSSTYQVLVVLFLSSFLIIEGILVFNISQFKKFDEIGNMDYVLVLGAGLDGEKVGKTLKSRLDEAIKYYNLHKDVKIIVSGGVGEDNTISEAQAMYNYLVEQGVDFNKIIKEDKATTTLENIKFSKDILKERNDEDKKVLIVTNEFHLYRSKLIANNLGMKNEGLSCSTPIKIRVNYLIREYPTLVIDVIKSRFSF